MINGLTCLSGVSGWLPGGIFAPFIPGDLAELKLKEIKNGECCAPAAFWPCLNKLGSGHHIGTQTHPEEQQLLHLYLVTLLSRLHV